MSLAPGVRLGAYEIVSLIGAGGMGEVYRAVDTRLGRTVAIKVLPAEVTGDDTARLRLFREAKTISSLDHPNICALYDVGRELGIDFLVMQYLEGETLAAALRRGPLDLETAVRYAGEIGDALDAAHTCGVIHRDLKPANVMITAGGARLLDFGLAVPRPPSPAASTQLPAEESTREVLTAPGMLLGTLPYMAPEQLEGQPADVRSDIFSFGAVFYEMLTGRRPFIATADAGVMTQILGVMPAPPSRLNRAVPAAVDAVVLRCLAKTPADRWQTIRAVLNALTVALNASHEARLMAKWGYAAGAAAMLMIVAVAGLPYLNRVTPSEPVAVGQPDSTTLVILPFEVDSQDAGERAFWNGLSQTVATKLAQLPAANHLHVAAFADVAARNVRTPDDARVELGATDLLRGRTIAANGDYRTTLDLIDTRTGATRRSTTVATPRSNPAASHNALLDGVLALLEIRLTAAARARVAARASAAGAYDFYLQGMGYLQDDDKLENVDNAITVFTRALDLDPDHAPARAGLGEAYWQKYLATRDAQWVDAARQACDRALGLDEAEPSPHMCLGTIENGVGRYEKAVEEFSHAVERAPDDEAAYLGLASAYRRLNDVTRAEENYRRAIAMRPGYWVGYSRLGEFYFRLQRHQEAQAMFEQVIALSPDSWRGYSNLGAVEYAQGRTSDALATLKRSMAIRPNYQAASNLGTLYYYELQDYGRAAEAYRQALDLNASEHVVWGNFGWALHWSGERDRSRTAFAKAASLAEQRLKINNRDPAVLMALADYYAALGEVSRGEPIVRQALAIAPDDARLMYKAGVFYEHYARDREQATRWLQGALTRGHSWQEVERDPALRRFRSDGALTELRRLVPTKPT